MVKLGFYLAGKTLLVMLGGMNRFLKGRRWLMLMVPFEFAGDILEDTLIDL